ncbi:MAG: hypothetical protein ACSLFQ_02200 [Thermoanaerobaculia bacterium]
MTMAQRVSTVLATVIMIVAIPARGADFYEAQLRLGAESLRAGRLQEAMDYLRVANFGLLDRTTLLAEGMVRLALAESAAGRTDDVQKTVTRFVSIERQFPSYAKAALDPDERASFEKLLLSVVPKEMIASVPSLAAIVPSVARATAEMTPDQRRRFLEGKVKSDSGNPEWPLALAREAIGRNDQRGALKWSERALRAGDGSGEAHAIRLSVFTARRDDSKALGELAKVPDEAWTAFTGVVPDAFVVYTRTGNGEQADLLATRITGLDLERSDVASAMESWRSRSAATTAAGGDSSSAVGESAGAGAPAASPVEGPADAMADRNAALLGSFTGSQDRTVVALTAAKKLMNENQPVEAQKVLRDELRRAPASRDLRIALLEASCLARDWRTGSAQLSLVEPFRDGEDRYRFYAAVVLFELGRADEAKPLMEAAAPKLARSPFVEHYVKAVLGTE